ncbi:DUF4230 domain-containing protein [Altibacter sp. HG106]|uniref:DUF4230 domain-containing protein n=1 Tax=Altibacter sp. HG106 TaxID=3023937 RepID=UPI0023506EE9|nr:DUF4230 domain-containing protein [Altibacter sp. HG106]MDC7994075.1 DUF4230 domain-containing protein [Altibacter sp. HG106]
METLFLGLGLGAIAAYFIFGWVTKDRKKQRAQRQSVVLMRQIRSVCKLITVEGDFSEIYHYESMKHKWVNRLLGKKKALVLIEAKAHVGFDLTTLQLEPDEAQRTIIVSQFPKPELLSIETDFKYYDKKEGWANPFTASDLTEINAEAKQYIVDKIPGSGLLEEAHQQAYETMQLLENLAATIHWKVDYSQLTPHHTSLLQNENNNNS